MFIQKTQKVVFSIALVMNSFALYDYFLDIRFVNGNFVITRKIDADDISAYKNKQLLMIEPKYQKYTLATIEAVQGERVTSENSKFEVQVPQGGFYAKIYNSNWIFSNFVFSFIYKHFNATIVGVPLLVI
ncbi:hypothetical protein pb186bvf_017571 [Paramecium bursaria]